LNTNLSKKNQIPQGLLAVAGKRDLITTSELAEVLNLALQTVHKKHSIAGEVYGIRPTKIGNRLLWPVAQIAEKLGGHKND